MQTKDVIYELRTKRGWCDFHKRWELITITPDYNMFFSYKH